MQPSRTLEGVPARRKIKQTAPDEEDESSGNDLLSILFRATGPRGGE